MKPTAIQISFLHKLVSMTFSSALLLMTMGISSVSIEAHNGAIAYAYPVSKITVDGDLSDWPTHLTRYSLEKIRVGVAPEDGKDLKASFRTCYNLELNTIYLAVEVIDQSIQLDTSNFVNWDTHDGLELYLDPNHLESSAAITQYAEYATKRFRFGFDRDWDGIESKMILTESGRIYEWSIKLDRELHQGMAISMDLVVIDKDEDNSYSWLAWGEFAQKLADPNRLGDLVLAGPETNLIEVTGKIDLSQLSASASKLPVRFESMDNDDFWLQTLADSTGGYQLLMPAGEYHMYVPQEMMRLDQEFYKIAYNEPIRFVVKSSQASPPVLIPKQISSPQLSVDRGILNDFDPQEPDLVDGFIDTYREFYKIPGVSLALIKDGKVVYHQTYGVTSTKTNEPVTDETLFEAASITKPVFGFAVLRLAEKGIIDLDQPLYQYLPFEALEETPEYKQMTARHVLIHQSGLPNWGVPLINTPGTKYGYSGEGFEYLKRVVCAITDKPIEQLLDEEVIGPLNLYHMEFKDTEELRAVAAIGHQGSNPTFWPIPKEPGMAHSMHTEAYAFSRFAIALLEEKGLQPETYRELEKIHTESPREYWDNPDYPEGAGLSVHVRTSPYGKVIGHGGNNGDFKCLFEVYQELDMGYVVFTNSSMGDQLAEDLAEFLVEGRGSSGIID